MHRIKSHIFSTVIGSSDISASEGNAQEPDEGEENVYNPRSK